MFGSPRRVWLVLACAAMLAAALGLFAWTAASVAWTWWASALLLVQVTLVPLAAGWAPVLRLLPLAYGWRVRRLLRRHYAILAAIENDLLAAETPCAFRSALRRLDQLRDDLQPWSCRIPLHLRSEVYQWRLHIRLVRQDALRRHRRLRQASHTRPSRLVPANFRKRKPERRWR